MNMDKKNSIITEIEQSLFSMEQSLKELYWESLQEHSTKSYTSQDDSLADAIELGVIATLQEKIRAARGFAVKINK